MKWRIWPFSNFNPLPSCEGRRPAGCTYAHPYHFNPLPSCEGRRGAGAGQRDHQNFNPLPSREGRRDDRKSILDIINFNPLPSREGRLSSAARAFARINFNPLPSCEGKPHGRFKTIADNPFQSTPLTRGETRIKKHEHRDQCISIHSPHARGDRVGAAITNLRNRISIHSPHARGDRVHAKRERGGVSNFNPLPSCEGRRYDGAVQRHKILFQSTPLMRGETYQLQYPACIE